MTSSLLWTRPPSIAKAVLSRYALIRAAMAASGAASGVCDQTSKAKYSSASVAAWASSAGGDPAATVAGRTGVNVRAGRATSSRKVTQS